MEKFGKLCKEKMMEELLLRFTKHPNFVITSFMGTSTGNLEQLRKNLRKSQANYFVVKNSILKIAFGKMKLEEEASKVEGGMGMALCGEDAPGVCSLLVNFAKTNDKFKIKGAVIDGRRLSADQVKELASLPPKAVLLARVVGGIKSPITGFVSTLGGIVRKFVYVVDAIKASKEKTQTAPVAQEAK
ncbi:MAG: 50S ribosomal protein L10 [Candidatus Omnitrophica bacterium]|nr:50S ribosomal protein L10 [Candidatus Omnitrophota bacterium]MDD5437150.1 50S ribosomal protein L10 [Candidatus Omnitrophota bacterium]